jgi:putative tryptophan/tyrosine transport system substrate-binding protein
MRRRQFITLLGGTAATWPVVARAQQPAMPVIGFLSSESPEPFAGRLRAFRQGLAETGYVEGRNVAIEYRWADNQIDQLAALAADLVRGQVTVIAAAGGTQSALAAKAATPTIPIVFVVATNPIEVGLVASLSRPDRNLTGVTNLGSEVEPKLLELLHELVPKATIIALLINPTNPTAEHQTKDLQEVARALGVQLHVLQTSIERDFDTVFATLVQLRAGALMISQDVFFNSRSEQLAALAVRHAVPAIAQPREFAAAGGLMSYGASVTEPYRQAGAYVARILKGAKIGDLPVQQATKVEMTLNLKTAKALGLTVPLALLTRADEVIE